MRDRLPKIFHVYIMASKPRGVLYVGMTSDLASRAWKHREHVLEGSHQALLGRSAGLLRVAIRRREHRCPTRERRHEAVADAIGRSSPSRSTVRRGATSLTGRSSGQRLRVVSATCSRLRGKIPDRLAFGPAGRARPPGTQVHRRGPLPVKPASSPLASPAGAPRQGRAEPGPCWVLSCATGYGRRCRSMEFDQQPQIALVGTKIDVEDGADDRDRSQQRVDQNIENHARCEPAVCAEDARTADEMEADRSGSKVADNRQQTRRSGPSRSGPACRGRGICCRGAWPSGRDP